MKSFGSAFFGLCLAGGAALLLWYNEGRSVKIYKSLKEGAGIVESISARQVNGGNDGKLVHIQGKVSIKSPVTDARLGISYRALGLQRKVAMLQYKEKKVEGSENEVHYSTGWYDSPVDSTGFKNRQKKNPPFSIKTKTWYNDTVTVEEFKIPRALVKKIKMNPLEANRSWAQKMQKQLGQRVTPQGDVYIVAKDASRPRVGDYRVSYAASSPPNLSLVGRQTGHTLEPYPAEAGDELFMARAGVMSAEAMFQKSISENKTLTWGLRVLGFLMMFFGFRLAFSPLSTFLTRVPIIGGLIAAGFTLAAAALALFFSSITMALAWFFYRPLLSGVLFITGAAIVYLVYQKGKDK